MANSARNLPEPLDSFVEQQVRSGAYDSRDAVIAEAVRRMKTDAESDDAKLVRLNAMLERAAIQLDAGEAEEVTDIRAYFEAIKAEASGR